jgi:concentrative nucleoside transporter, CNT family
MAQYGKPIGLVFFFGVLTTIIFFASLMSILYHLGIMQAVVKAVAWVMVRTMGTSGAESLSAAANIFVGQTEAPLVVRPYVAQMTRSELMAVMTGGFATIAGGVMAAYVAFGIDAGHLLTASVISAPASLVMAKLMEPETEEPLTKGTVRVTFERTTVNLIDAAAVGAADGLRLAFNVAAMLVAFLALLAMINAFLGWLDKTFISLVIPLQGRQVPQFGDFARLLVCAVSLPARHSNARCPDDGQFDGDKSCSQRVCRLCQARGFERHH